MGNCRKRFPVNAQEWSFRPIGFFRLWVMHAILSHAGGHVMKNLESVPDFKKISAAYFRERGDAVAYEASAKLVFRVQLPFLDVVPFHESMTPYSNETIFLIQRTTSTIVEEFWSYVHGLETRRKKRQLVVGALAAGAFIGYELHSVWTSIAKKFSGSESDAEQSLQQLKSGLAATKQDHLMFVHNITGFSRNLTSTVNNLVYEGRELEKTNLWLLHLIQSHIAISRVESGIERCINRMIPFQILKAKDVELKLAEIQTSIAHTGYHVALSAGELIRDESLKIASCYITDRNIYVLINVPIRKVDWKITEMVPVPFANRNQTCSLENMEPKVLAVSREKIVVVENFHTSCNLQTDKMCLVPTYSHPSVENMDCVALLYQNATVNHVSDHCKFKCSNSTQMTISQLDISTVVITFAKRISVSCPNQSPNYKIPSFGSVEMTIKCNCSYNIDDEQFDGTGICINENFKENDVSIIVPYFVSDPEWSSTKNSTKWIDLVSDLSLHASENNIEYMTISGFHYRDFWLGVLSLSGFLLLVGLIVIAYFVKKLN